METKLLESIAEKLDKLIELQIKQNQELSELNEQADKIYFNQEFREFLFSKLDKIKESIESQ